MARNQALHTNAGIGQRADLEITNHGSDRYYTVCAVMGTATLVFWFQGLRKPYPDRTFNNITAASTFVACIAYFTMGSNLGQVPVLAEWTRPSSTKVGAAGTREIFYVRYIDWFITTPLLLLDLLLTSRMPLPMILSTIFADLIMVVCGLVGALVSTGFKWGFWTFGSAAFLLVVWQILVDGRRHAFNPGGPDLFDIYARLIFYGVLDIISKVGFGVVLLAGHRNIPSDDTNASDENGQAVTQPRYSMAGGPTTSNPV
ncbi:putative heat shock protein 30 [Podospora australis]|uniref:Heat shock protein 30 n=1 Tax=Podospora australis TaxID=1536484 RepID=A0AAN6X007_9PEZI|nr:putative heat shock protein 30 [Podospora australis]